MSALIFSRLSRLSRVSGALRVRDAYTWGYTDWPWWCGKGTSSSSLRVVLLSAWMCVCISLVPRILGELTDIWGNARLQSLFQVCLTSLPPSLTRRPERCLDSSCTRGRTSPCFDIRLQREVLDKRRGARTHARAQFRG